MDIANVFANNGLNNTLGFRFLFCFSFENDNCSQALNFASETAERQFNHFRIFFYSGGTTKCKEFSSGPRC